MLTFTKLLWYHHVILSMLSCWRHHVSYINITPEVRPRLTFVFEVSRHEPKCRTSEHFDLLAVFVITDVISFHPLGTLNVCAKCLINSLNSRQDTLFHSGPMWANGLRDRHWTSPKMKRCHHLAEMLLSFGFPSSRISKTYVKVFRSSCCCCFQLENSLWLSVGLSGELKVRLNLCVGFVCGSFGQVGAGWLFWFGRWTREKLQPV